MQDKKEMRIIQRKEAKGTKTKELIVCTFQSVCVCEFCICRVLTF